jgi:hypothetical protein
VGADLSKQTKINVSEEEVVEEEKVPLTKALTFASLLHMTWTTLVPNNLHSSAAVIAH